MNKFQTNRYELAKLFWERGQQHDMPPEMHSFWFDLANIALKKYEELSEPLVLNEE